MYKWMIQGYPHFRKPPYGNPKNKPPIAEEYGIDSTISCDAGGG